MYVTKLSVSIRPECKVLFADWQADLNADIAGFDGFISLEFLMAFDSNWEIIQKFKNKESQSLWSASPTCLQLLNQLKSLVLREKINETRVEDTHLKNGVTEVIITKVDPKQEESYRKWSAKIHQIEAKFKGFRGVYIQSPRDKSGSHWITLLQFDTPENLDRWLESKERKEVLEESNLLISSLETHRVISPYGGWFYSKANQGEIPFVWKQTMMVLMVLFPIVLLEQKYLSPLTHSLNPSLATFISNALSVSLIAFPCLPIAIYLLGWWLFPKGENKLLITFFGSFILFLIYSIEVFIFWK